MNAWMSKCWGYCSTSGNLCVFLFEPWVQFLFKQPFCGVPNHAGIQSPLPKTGVLLRFPTTPPSQHVKSLFTMFQISNVVFKNSNVVHNVSNVVHAITPLCSGHFCNFKTEQRVKKQKSMQQITTKSLNLMVWEKTKCTHFVFMLECLNFTYFWCCRFKESTDAV